MDKYGYTKVDTNDATIQRLIVANLSDMTQMVRAHDERLGSQFVRRGIGWYPTVERATEKGVKKHFGSLPYALSGPGVVASVSPNMDWSGANIHAFGELARLSSSDWGAIEKSSQGSGGGKKGRSPAAKKVLEGKSIAKAPDSNLMKARRILEGENPEEVLNPRTAPKTYSFMHNIAGNPLHVTIDGRAHDMAVNQMRHWEADRGIGSALNVRGGPTRYEQMAEGYRAAANYVNSSNLAVHDVRTGRQIEVMPHHLQAILWEYGKHLERTMTGTGKGPPRVGQKYIQDLPMLAPARVIPPKEPKSASAPASGGSPAESGQESPPGQVPAVGRSREQRRRGRALGR